MLGISKDTVHALPEVHYPGRVIMIDSAAKAKDAVAYLLKQPQIGFDTETRPSFQKNHHYKVSLVQLSVPGECFLFRLKQIGSLDGLMSIFENPNIQKIGLSLKDDFHSLAKLCEFTPAGFVELQTFVKDYEIADNSLQKIFALIFGLRISKNQRLTNWEASELTPGQQTYAAIDAWACVEIYNYLCAGKFHPEECPYRIDDQTAKMLQSSVGIRMPLKHLEGYEPPKEGVLSSAYSAPPDINSVPVKKGRRKSAGDSSKGKKEESVKVAPKPRKSGGKKKSEKPEETKEPKKKSVTASHKVAPRKTPPAKKNQKTSASGSQKETTRTKTASSGTAPVRKTVKRTKKRPSDEA